MSAKKKGRRHDGSAGGTVPDFNIDVDAQSHRKALRKERSFILSPGRKEPSAVNLGGAEARKSHMDLLVRRTFFSQTPVAKDSS